jgi:hypothetical protein
MSKFPNFARRLIAVIGSVLLVVASVAFITIPYSLGGHPGDAIATGANPQYFHPT